MDKQKILSVSVACYNLKDMIETNIKSFCESSVADDVELIITDDGSTDNTLEYAEKWEKQYPNVIKLIRKKNEGPGSTVNSGIKHATGKYFRMVDGDDWVNSKNLELFIEFLRGCDSDLVISDYDIYDNENKKIIETKTCSLSPLNQFHVDKAYLNIPFEMHSLTYKTSILKENEISLDNCFYTDVEYTLFPMKYVNTISYFNKTIYIYRVAQATQSVNPNSMKKNVAQHELVLNHVIEDFIVNEKNMSIGQKTFIAKRIASMCDVQLTTYLYFEPTKEQKRFVKDFINSIKQYPEIYSEFKKGKKLKLLKWSNFVLFSIVRKLVLKKTA